MAARFLGLAAAFGLGANAFLFHPPGLPHDVKADLDIARWLPMDPASHQVLVPCKGCEVDGSGPMSLLLNISIGSAPGTLELGGKPFYPPSEFLFSEPSNKPQAQVVPEGAMLFDIVSSLAPTTEVSITNWSFRLRHSEKMDERGEELLNLDLHIIDVNKATVNVPDVRVIFIKDSELDTLVIVGAHAVLDDEPQRHEIGNEDKPACETTFCQWRQFVEDKVHGIAAAAHDKFGSGRPFGHGRLCPGKMNGMMKGGMPHVRPFTTLHHGPDSHQHRPLGGDEQPPHGPHGPHHEMHHFINRVGRVIVSIMNTVLIGFLAGVTAYAVGMLLGCAIGLIWFKVFRRGKRGYASVAQAEDEAAAKEAAAEADARTSFESAPPVYEDAPAYEEKQVV